MFVSVVCVCASEIRENVLSDTALCVLHVCMPGRENDNLAHLFAVKEDAPKAREEIAEYLVL